MKSSRSSHALINDALNRGPTHDLTALLFGISGNEDNLDNLTIHTTPPARQTPTIPSLTELFDIQEEEEEKTSDILRVQKDDNTEPHYIEHNKENSTFTLLDDAKEDDFEGNFTEPSPVANQIIERSNRISEAQDKKYQDNGDMSGLIEHIKALIPNEKDRENFYFETFVEGDYFVVWIGRNEPNKINNTPLEQYAFVCYQGGDGNYYCKHMDSKQYSNFQFSQGKLKHTTIKPLTMKYLHDINTSVDAHDPETYTGGCPLRKEYKRWKEGITLQDDDDFSHSLNDSREPTQRQGLPKGRIFDTTRLYLRQNAVNRIFETFNNAITNTLIPSASFNPDSDSTYLAQMRFNETALNELRALREDLMEMQRELSDIEAYASRMSEDRNDDHSLEAAWFNLQKDAKNVKNWGSDIIECLNKRIELLASESNNITPPEVTHFHEALPIEGENPSFSNITKSIDKENKNAYYGALRFKTPEGKDTYLGIKAHYKTVNGKPSFSAIETNIDIASEARRIQQTANKNTTQHFSVTSHSPMYANAMMESAARYTMSNLVCRSKNGIMFALAGQLHGQTRMVFIEGFKDAKGRVTPINHLKIKIKSLLKAYESLSATGTVSALFSKKPEDYHTPISEIIAFAKESLDYRKALGRAIEEGAFEGKKTIRMHELGTIVAYYNETLKHNKQSGIHIANIPEDISSAIGKTPRLS